MPSGSFTNLLASLNPLRRRTSLRESLHSFSSASSIDTSLKEKTKSRTTSSYYPYTVYEQKQGMLLLILRDPEAARKLFEAILDSPNGKRALSRLARTCRAICEPALNVLWRELDSIVPLIGLFPANLMKKARRPALGLVKAPQGEDWKNVLKHSERIRRITYDESANNFAMSVFQMLEEHRPRAYILPRLQELCWKVETPAGLSRCSPFLNPELQSIALEIGAKFPQLNTFLADMSSRTKLVSFSFISPTTLPDAFTDLLQRQNALERIVLVAPGALSPAVGRWTASLPHLKHLQLDLSGRSMIAVEGFFDELRPRSGDSTPSSVGSTDSGVFSGEELDFSEIRKSALRLTGDLHSKGSFAQMRKLHLTGDVSNIAVFLKHLTSPLTQLDLVIEDPPERADWQDLCAIICERFTDSLQSLRVTATGSSRFLDLVRSTSRAEPQANRLSLEYLTLLPCLNRLEIDLPESVIFTDSDIENLARTCPNLETLRLCPLARFSPAMGPPKVTLDSMAHLISSCRRLHTLAIVINAQQGSPKILASRLMSSKSLSRLHVGHSWVGDSLQVAILLSHLSPHLEGLKWFQDKNRPGYNEANARGWQLVSDTLPHLQNVRLAEREFAAEFAKYMKPHTSEKSIDATIKTVDRGVHAVTRMTSRAIQFSPAMVSRLVEARPDLFSVSIDATPPTTNVGVNATTSVSNQSVDARPSMVSTAVDATVFTVSKSIDASPPSKTNALAPRRSFTTILFFPSILGLFSLAYRIFVSYPLSIPSRILQLSLARFRQGKVEQADSGENNTASSTPSYASSASGTEAEDIPLDNLQVGQ